MDMFYAIFWVYPGILVFGMGFAIYYSRKMNRQLAEEQRAGRAMGSHQVPLSDRAAIDARYAALGLSPQADDDQLRRRYHTLAKEWHPDRLAGVEPWRRAEAERHIRLINAAYAAIMAERAASQSPGAAPVAGAD